DPFAGEIDDGRLYGRGSSDMKSGIAAFVVAVTDLAPRLAGTPGVVLVLTAGEETGCEGASRLAATGTVLGEAGAVVVAEPTSNMPFVGHKGALWLRARTHGVTAHGSMPEKGVNAIYKAAHAIGKLEDFDFNVERHAVLGGPTLNVGTVHGGININSVPDQAEIGIDIRTVPGQKHARIREQMAAYLGEDVEVSAITDVEGIWTDPADPWIQEVFAVMQAVMGHAAAASGATYFTDAAYLTPAFGGPPTVILGPGEPAMAHQTDEYCRIDRLNQAVAAYTELTRRWCGL
ncbi:MAG: M20 family metallopeptidase, partial [Rhodospirillales bacterium]|nr:M20 family metallopeptidase [Rhodospirillales bacterium]